MEYKTCPNCNKKLDGFMTSRYIINDDITKLINAYRNENSKAYCNGCAVTYLHEYTEVIKSQKENLISVINSNLHLMPIITAPNPPKWDYSVINIVSSQSVTGTGILSEIASSWTDLLGGQSGTLQDKLSQGELICRNQLRYKAAMLGANAIIAADVDYAEVGGGKGMLMVCMSGTAVKINNADDVLFIDEERLNILCKAFEDLNKLPDLAIPIL